MALFGSKKQPQVAETQKGSMDSGMVQAGTGISSVLILGSGCEKCNELETNTRAALKELGVSPEIGHVTDFAEIARYGVMTTPALVVDGKVVSYGKVLKSTDVVKLLQKITG